MKILEEREKTYGQFINNATMAQQIKVLMRKSGHWNKLAYDQCEALDVIASKIARACCGDTEYVDNWVDIAGYATLVFTRMQEKTNA